MKEKVKITEQEKYVLEVNRLLNIKNIGAWNRRFLFSLDKQLLSGRELTGKQKFTLKNLSEGYKATSQ